MALYTLDLDRPKRNVFVTQLRDEDNDDSRKFPVVKESENQLLSTGVKTLQSTRLLKENLQAQQMCDDLQTKQSDFRKQMLACKDKETKLAKRQCEIKDRVNKFDKFIKETEAKRRRALATYQKEHKILVQKAQELETYKNEIAGLRLRHIKLKNKVEEYSIYEKYLIKVLEIIPEDYLANSCDSKMMSLMMRYETLISTNQLLKDSLTTLTDKVKYHQQIINDFQAKYDQQLMVNTNQLGALQHQLEKYIQGNAKLEQVIYNMKEVYRKQSSILGNAKLAVFNIAETCLSKNSRPLENMTLDSLLTFIQEFMVQHEDICKIANLLEVPKFVNSSIKEALTETFDDSFNIPKESDGY